MARRLLRTGYRVVVEIGLRDAACIGGDFAHQGERGAENRRAFKLRADAVGHHDLAHVMRIVRHLPVDGLHIDLVRAPEQYPTILDLTAPQLWAYSRETVIAEKFEAMVKLGQLNSRMKDFFDIWALSSTGTFAGPALCESIKTTFDRRGTAMDTSEGGG